MGIEEGTDEHWVLYGNQFDNKFHILKKKKKHNTVTTSKVLQRVIYNYEPTSLDWNRYKGIP